MLVRGDGHAVVRRCRRYRARPARHDHLAGRARCGSDPGDALVFYTDGVTERRRGRELFGIERLRDAAAPLAGYSAEVVAARLRSAAIGFSAESPRDDIAILVLRNDAVG